jgi:putative oxidoreductase
MTRDVGALIGRILLALIFVLSGFQKLMGPAGTMKLMAAHGLPLVPLVYIATILVEFGCGLLLVLGYKARWAAMLIFLWFIPVTLVFHVAAYHQAVLQQKPMDALIQQIMFMKNISIMGGLLMVASFGPGAISLDGRGETESLAGSLRAA